MTLRSLEIFESVARHGKMNDAAQELHIAQPTISQAVAELEKEYGVLLFDRLSKKLFITEIGKQFLEYAKTILRTAKEMEQCMANLSVHKTILLGATITVGKCVLVDLVKAFEARYPQTEIRVTIDNTTIIEALLLESKLDLALVEGNIKSTELAVTPAIPDSLVLVCHREHPFAAQQSVRMAELAGQPFILREEGSGTREIFMSRLREHGVQADVKWSCHGFDSILEAVLANQGLTVISARIAQPYAQADALRIVPIEGVAIDRNFSLVHHKTKYVGGTLAQLIDLILEGDFGVKKVSF